MTTSPIGRRGFLKGALGIGTLAATGSLAAACAAPGGTSAQPSSLAAPSASGSAAKGEITIWNRSGDLFKVFDAAIAKFRQAYPNVKVDHQAVDIDAKLANTLISGTDVPDGSFWDDAKIGGQAEHLFDLTDLIAPYKEQTSAYKLSVNTVDGKIYGVPWDLDPGLLWYREDVLESAGVDPASLATYDDLLAASRTIKEKDPKTRPIHLEKTPFLSQLWLEMLANQQGTSLTDAQGRLRLESEEYRRIFTWIQTAVKDGLVTHAPTWSRPTSTRSTTASRCSCHGRSGGRSRRSSSSRTPRASGARRRCPPGRRAARAAAPWAAAASSSPPRPRTRSWPGCCTSSCASRSPATPPCTAPTTSTPAACPPRSPATPRPPTRPSRCSSRSRRSAARTCGRSPSRRARASRPPRRSRGGGRSPWTTSATTCNA
ncbi:ABC transporter substrate-binding protein [Nonomuraea thailandensis]